MGADVARVPRMNLCHVATHMHWTEHGRVAERKRIVLSARRSCADKRHRRNSGDRKETSQLFSLRWKVLASPRYPRKKKNARSHRMLVCRLRAPPLPRQEALPVESAPFAWRERSGQVAPSPGSRRPRDTAWI